MAQGQKADTIKIAYNEMLTSKDTIYFGIMDSEVILPHGSEYKLQRNILFRSNELYETNPKKKKKIETRVQYYSDAWNKAYNYSTIDTTAKHKKNVSNSESYFRQFEGKIIRSISYNAVDMFEGQVLDTTQYAMRSFNKVLNKVHTPTQEFALRQNLRFKTNDIVNAREVSETERLLRELDYIQDARITITQENLLSDSVDVTIITQDRLPVGIKLSVSDYNEFSLTPYINNIAGTGNYLEAGFDFAGDESNPLGYTVKYNSQNIAGTFVNVGAYRVVNNQKDNYGMVIERPFRTTEMKVGGAFSFSNTKQNRTYKHEILDTTITSAYHSLNYDTWLGKTFNLANTTELPNISIAGRYYYNTYEDRPIVQADSNLIFHDTQFFLGSAMLQKVKFFQTKKLADFGSTEDIPIGYTIKTTTGPSWNNYYTRLYSGLNMNLVTVTKNNSLISYSLSTSNYFYNDHFEDNYINYNTIYISPLKELKYWEMRHCLSFGTELISNERYYSTYNLSLSAFDINHPYYRYNSLAAVQYKPMFHAPFKVLGFNFSATPSVTMAFCSEDDYYSGYGEFFSVISMDLRMKNESLIFPTVGLKIDYYPTYGSTSHQVGFSFYAKNTSIIENIFSPKPKINKP